MNPDMLRLVRQLLERWAPKPKPFVPVHRDVFSLRLEEWRSNQALVKQAAEILRNPLLQDMIFVLRTEHLGLRALPVDAPTDAVAAMQRQAEGYQIALNNFEALGKYEVPKEPIEATFEPDPKVESE